jgi:hypothetical protein
MKFVCPSSYLLLVEMWATRPVKECGGYLQQVVLNEKANERLRATALRSDACSKDKAFLQAVLQVESAALRSLALRELTNVDEKLGQKYAEAVLGQYNSGKPMSTLNPKGDTSVVTAMEVLYKLKKLKLEHVKPAVTRALGEFVYEKPEVTAEGMKPFRFSPPILETCAWMLGAIGDKSGFATLKLIATNNTVTAGRAEALRSMVHFPGDDTQKLLGTMLEDEDGWTRYNAYLSLKVLTGKEYFCDWIYGSKDDRKEATEKYKELVKKGGK